MMDTIQRADIGAGPHGLLGRVPSIDYRVIHTAIEPGS
jgi:hypothetical protein